MIKDTGKKIVSKGLLLIILFYPDAQEAYFPDRKKSNLNVRRKSLLEHFLPSMPEAFHQFYGYLPNNFFQRIKNFLFFPEFYYFLLKNYKNLFHFSGKVAWPNHRQLLTKKVLELMIGPKQKMIVHSFYIFQQVELSFWHVTC